MEYSLEVCPICGGTLDVWYNDIAECSDCGAMFDTEEFTEEDCDYLQENDPNKRHITEVEW